MKSPFAIFRKHQRILTVVLTGLAMFAFIIMDQLDPSSNSFTMILGALLGAGLFWFVGRKTSKPVLSAVAGLVLGGALGMFLPQTARNVVAVETAAGNLSLEDIQELVQTRQIANNFLAAAYQEAVPRPDFSSDQNQFLTQFLNQQWQAALDNSLFRYSNRPVEQDVVLGYLFRHEARQMGITVTDEAVTEYISQVTDNKLARTAFPDICKRLRVTARQVYDALRDELLARRALELSAPAVPLTPEQHWNNFLKLNTTVSLEAVPVSVDQFTESVGEPTDAELQSLFEQYKDQFPGLDGTPGFLQPNKVKVAYLEADYVTIESLVPDVTDAEITEFYAQNKEAFYRIRNFPSESPAGEEPSTEVITPESSEKPAPESQSPADGASSETPATPAPTTPQPAADETGADNDNPQEPAPGDDGDSCVIFYYDEPTPEEPAAPQSQDEKPAPPPLPTTPPKPEEPKPEQPKPEQPKPEEPKPEEPKPEEPKPEQPKPEQPKPEEPKPEQPNTAVPPAPTTPEETPEFRPLDDDLKSEIRDQLLRERTQNAMQDRIRQAMELMLQIGPNFNRPQDDPDKLTAEQIRRQLEAFAKTTGLKYRETGLMSAQELRTSEEHPIGSATEPVENPFARQNAVPVVARLLGAEPNQPIDNLALQVYTVDQAEDPLTSNLFAYWPIEYSEAHVPTMDEPGVRDAVVEAWGSQQARPKAEERAKELAEEVRKAMESGKSMTEALSETTVKGQENGPQPMIQVTPEFAWYSRTAPSTPQMNLLQDRNRPPVQLSTVPGIENAGRDFMEVVFTELDEGAVGIAANQDKSTYYLVHVKSRTPSVQAGDAGLKSRFIQNDPFQSTEQGFLSMLEQSETRSRWWNQFEERYAINWAGLQDNR